MNHITNELVKRSHHTNLAPLPLPHTYAAPQMSQAILPGQSSTPPTNVTIPTIPFTCLKGLHGNCMRHCWGTTTRGDKEPQTEKISNLKATQGPKAPAPHAATPPEATPERERCTRYGTMHPIRGTAPDQKRCIAYGSGVAPQRTRTNAELANRAAPGPHPARA